MIHEWNLGYDCPGFIKYVDLVESFYHDIKNLYRRFGELEEKDVETLLNWIGANAYRLEDGFFIYEQKDPAFSARISKALYALESWK